MRLALVLAALALTRLDAAAEPSARERRLETRSAAAAEGFRSAVAAEYFDDAHAYAVLPRATRFGAGLGGAFGRGVLYVHGRPVQRVRHWQMTSGIQAGARAYSLIVFFRDADALEEAREHGVRFAGQAGIAAARAGTLKTPGYSSGVAIFAQHRFGLMLEATIAVSGLGLRPL